MWCFEQSLFLSPASFSVPQVARAGRFGTKGLAITFVSDETDAKTLNDVQDRFEVNVAELPEEIDISSYSKFCCASQVALHMVMLTFSNHICICILMSWVLNRRLQFFLIKVKCDKQHYSRWNYCSATVLFSKCKKSCLFGTDLNKCHIIMI